MKPLIRLTFTFLIISFCCKANLVDPPHLATKDQILKVMTYNLHHCNPPSAGDKIDVEAIAKVISNAKPDFVALQEVDVNTERSGKGINQAEELARLTGMNFYFSKAIDHQGGDYGVAVLSKFPILDSARFALPLAEGVTGEPRTIAAITVEISKGKKIIFASTHLDLKEQTRLSQAALIVQYFEKSALPMIIGGDFNALPDSKVIQYLDQYFTRTCQKCEPTIPVENPDRTIDFIMFKPGKGIESLSTKVIDEKYASDHLPVIAELRVKK